MVPNKTTDRLSPLAYNLDEHAVLFGVYVAVKRDTFLLQVDLVSQVLLPSFLPFAFGKAVLALACTN